MDAVGRSQKANLPTSPGHLVGKTRETLKRTDNQLIKEGIYRVTFVDTRAASVRKSDKSHLFDTRAKSPHFGVMLH